MKIGTWMLVPVIAIAAPLCLQSVAHGEETPQDLVREALRQQSAAQKSACIGVQRTLEAGSDATIVTRTAIEIGYNACQVIRCALDGKPEPKMALLCEKVIRGAAQAGAQPDLIARCASDYCDPTLTAAVLGDAFLETNYCYFAAQPTVAPDPVLPEPSVVDRSRPESQASTYRF